MEDENWHRQLIDLISSLPLLYNQYHPDKKNKRKIESAWKKVATKMNSTVKHCRMKWNNLRSTYARKHKKSTEIPSGSGFQPPETWPYFQQLNFLDSYIKHRRSNLSPAETFSTTLNGAVNSPLQFEPPDSPESVDSNATEPHAKRAKMSFDSSEEIQSQMLSVIQKSNEMWKSLDVPTKDKFDHFAAFVAAELREKAPNVAGLYIQKITNILCSGISVQDTGV